MENVRGGNAGVLVLVSMPMRTALPRLTSLAAFCTSAGVMLLSAPIWSLAPHFDLWHFSIACAWLAAANDSPRASVAQILNILIPVSSWLVLVRGAQSRAPRCARLEGKG